MAAPEIDPDVGRWLATRTFRGSPPELGDLVAAKTAAGARITVCLPALNESSTIAHICSAIRDELMGTAGLVDQLLVVDSGSDDDTVAVAHAAHAHVVSAADVLPQVGAARGGGKGEALWKGLAVAEGDVIVFVDSDLRNFEPAFVTRLIAPLLADDSLMLVKAFYERPIVGANGELAPGGARVTELVARPLLNLLYPALAGMIQPLSGECAARRDVLMGLPFMTGYGVEVGLLIDVAERFGLGAIAQTDLGLRVHRNQDVAALGRMASQVVQGALWRLERLGHVKLEDALPGLLLQFAAANERVVPRPFEVGIEELPPMRTVLGGPLGG